MDLAPASFVSFLQNHDQVANSLSGRRIHELTDPARLRALTAYLLLGPATPMLFQGQEFAASAPFLYFADHHAELAPLVAEGRRKFLAQFPSVAAAEQETTIAAPGDEGTFQRCKLDLAERETHAEIYCLHRDLLALRRDDEVFRNPRHRSLDGAVLGPETFVLRYFGEGENDRLLIVNLGSDLHLDPAPEPLLTPVAGTLWDTLWSSEDIHYGGLGTPPIDTEENWKIPGHAAVVLTPKRAAEAREQ